MGYNNTMVCISYVEARNIIRTQGLLIKKVSTISNSQRAIADVLSIYRFLLFRISVLLVFKVLLMLYKFSIFINKIYHIYFSFCSTESVGMARGFKFIEIYFFIQSKLTLGIIAVSILT